MKQGEWDGRVTYYDGNTGMILNMIYTDGDYDYTESKEPKLPADAWFGTGIKFNWKTKSGKWM